MKNITAIKETLGDHAKDTKLNLSQIFTEEGAPGLSNAQIWEIAAACAWSISHQNIIQAVQSDAKEVLNDEQLNAAKAASSIMAMNNIYYRFLHTVEDDSFKKMPARLRMNVIAKPGVPKADFELMCLAVSALNGCGMCINSHVEELKKAGVSLEGIQSAIRIAAVMNAFKQSIICAM